MKSKPILNHLQLTKALFDAKDQVMRLNAALSCHWATPFIEAVHNNNDLFFHHYDFAEKLAKELLERDEPMAFETIKEAFIFSGYPFNDLHILAARPDSSRTIAEQREFYRE